MKLIFCPYCHDVVKLLVKRNRTCDCGTSWGYYTDTLNAEIGGAAIPLGFANPSLGRALRGRPSKGMGEKFDAFVIPVECPTIKQHGEPQVADALIEPDAAKIMNWLQDMHTLHREVQAYYTVDGYCVVVTHDDAHLSKTYEGKTLLDAYRECAKEWKNGYPINVPVGLRQNEGH